MRPTPSSITTRGPRRSIRRPREGLRTAETRKPKENAPAVTPRSQPNSSRIGGERSEKGGRAVTPPPLVTKAAGTMNPPEKKGSVNETESPEARPPRARGEFLRKVPR